MMSPPPVQSSSATVSGQEVLPWVLVNLEARRVPVLHAHPETEKSEQMTVCQKAAFVIVWFGLAVQSQLRFKCPTGDPSSEPHRSSSGSDRSHLSLIATLALKQSQTIVQGLVTKTVSLKVHRRNRTHLFPRRPHLSYNSWISRLTLMTKQRQVNFLDLLQCIPVPVTRTFRPPCPLWP